MTCAKAKADDVGAGVGGGWVEECVSCAEMRPTGFREMLSQGRGGKNKGRESRGGVTRGGGRMKVVDGKGTSSGDVSSE